LVACCADGLGNPEPITKSNPPAHKIVFRYFIVSSPTFCGEAHGITSVCTTRDRGQLPNAAAKETRILFQLNQYAETSTLTSLAMKHYNRARIWMNLGC
jgi:hypothetical protein